MKSSYSHSIAWTLAPTLLGLLLLLTVPLVGMLRMNAYQERIINDLGPAQTRIRETIQAAYALHSDAFTYMFTLEDRHRQSYRQRLQQWQRLASEEPIARTGDRAALDAWRQGTQEITQWLQRYAAVYIASGEDERNVAEADRLFLQGQEHLEKASAAVAKVANRARQQAQRFQRNEHMTEIGLGLLCLLLALLAWRNACALSSALDASARNAERLAVAVKETNHRVKNNLQMIGALIEMHRTGGEETVRKSALDEIAQQIRMVASVHNFLSLERRNDTVPIQAMLANLVKLVAAPNHVQIDLRSASAELPVKEATSLALITNELILNAGKHGAAHVRVQFAQQDQQFVLCVTDDGPGFPSDFDSAHDANLGLTMVDTLARHDLDGSVGFQNGGDLGGGQVAVQFPLKTN